VLGDFVTERLALRPLSSEDLDRLADLNRDAEVMRFITGRPSSIDETAVELEVALGTRWLAWGHGYATEAARELIAEKSPPAMSRIRFLLRPRVNAASGAAVTQRRTPWPSTCCSSTTEARRRP
jgi:RimJ/RimL family protein N-acetyltransferase